MRLRCVLPVTVMLASTLVAHADTMSTFSVNATGGGFTLAGDFALDTTMGSVTGSNLLVAGPSLDDPLTFVDDGEAGRTAYNITWIGDATTYGPGDYYYMLLNGTSTLQNFSGGPFYFSGEVNEIDLEGTAVLTSTVTPEPSAIFLVGTGLLGVVGVVRRRYYESPRKLAHHPS